MEHLPARMGLRDLGSGQALVVAVVELPEQVAGLDAVAEPRQPSGVPGAHGYGQDQLAGLASAQSTQGRLRGDAGRQTVVDEDHVAPFEFRQSRAAAVVRDSTVQFGATPLI